MISGVKFAHSLLLVAVLGGVLHAQREEGPVQTRVIVRADVKKHENAPVLRTTDIKINVAGRDLPVLNVAPLVSAPGLSGATNAHPVEVAVVLDDGLRSNFATNLSEITDFTKGLVAPNIAASVGYMRNGAVYFAQPFSRDPDVVAKGVRLPISTGGVNGSPYFCVQELVKHWPTNTNAARVVLMITNGIDRYNGSVSPLNQNSPYVDQAVRDAQRAGVPIYSIYFGGRAINGMFSSASGQNYLAELAEGTGGETYNQGQITPPSIAPFLRQFQDALARSYDVSFQDSGDSLQRLKVSTSVPDVKLKAQTLVQAGPAQRAQ